MTVLRALFLGTAVCLAVAGCGKGKAPDNAAAAGEVLPRSVTDDMLPYDTIRSQPSLSPDAVLAGDLGHPHALASANAEENEEVVSDAAPTDKPIAGASAKPTSAPSPEAGQR